MSRRVIADRDAAYVIWIVHRLYQLGHLATVPDIMRWLGVVEHVLCANTRYRPEIYGPSPLLRDLRDMVRQGLLRVVLRRIGQRWGYFVVPGRAGRAGRALHTLPCADMVSQVMLLSLCPWTPLAQQHC